MEKDNYSKEDLWIHDETDLYKAQMLARFFDDPRQADFLPRPFGVLNASKRVCYEDQLLDQLNEAIEQKGEGDLNELIAGSVTWEI